MEASIAFKNITKRYGEKTVLRQISFGVEKGSILCIVGPGDAGKTTLLNILTGLTRADGGNVYVDGKTLDENRKHIKKLIGYMPEVDALNPELTLLQNLRMSGLLYGMDSETILLRINQYFEEYNLLDFIHSYPDEVSASVRRVVAFVRTILPDQDILLFDTPTAKADFSAKKRIWEYIRSCRGDKTVVVTLRDVNDAVQYSDRIIYMEHGKVITDGAPEKLREDAGIKTEYILHFTAFSQEHHERLKSLEDVADIERDADRVILRLRNPGIFNRILQEFKRDIRDYEVNEFSLNEVLFETPHIEHTL